MPERGPSKHPHGLKPCVHKEPPPPPPPVSGFQWQRLSMGMSGKKIILLGLTAAGIAGIYVLVKNGTLNLPDLADLPDFPDWPTLPKMPQLYIVQSKPKKKDSVKPTESEHLTLGQCKFGYQDV